ncbi:hypothetical protein [sulfur-oxidizing endosymbiont of Gigantopelta aegis]|uniref:hypothetical protein n=1 Tax=sulfur-oxidizing endosymbiont of Gigantopelta aegis TaxID=2794934 RepID=UPI0018DBDA7E|nr:hypothetical protein [sulfur-oxidizing endosymbiont of Gigantopelta aegis]
MHCFQACSKIVYLIALTLMLCLNSSLVYADDSDDFLTPRISTHEKVALLLQATDLAPQKISICFNYGCHSKKIIHIPKHTIEAIKNVFSQADSSSKGERLAIAQSIALLEQVAASQTPVYNDKAKNFNDNGLSGRMDCIDSTVNSTHYLEFIKQLGLLQRHELYSPIYRSPYLMGQHWSAQIKDKRHEQYYAVDSWPTDIGQPPVIQIVEQWKTREAINEN